MASDLEDSSAGSGTDARPAEGILSRADAWLREASPQAVLALAVLAIGFLGLADYATGRELSSAVFYTAPVALAAWYGGRWVSALACFMATLTWYAADAAAGAQYSAPWIPWWNSGVRLAFFAIIALLLHHLRGALEDLRRLAESDGLTGLANVRQFLSKLERELERATRYERPLSLAFIDLDGFKAINDTRGHAGGDDVLEAVGSALRGSVRASDLAARLGGDEFAVMFVETGEIAARDVAAKLRTALESAAREHGWPIGFSIGVYTRSNSGLDAAEVVRRADALMYEAKRQGKGRTLFGP